MDVSSLPPLRDIVRQYGLSARKGIGQHFLFDLNLTDRIVRSAGPVDGCEVIEVGPGPGALTRSLLATSARRVIAIEIDGQCINALEGLSRVAKQRLILLAKDALTVDIPKISSPPRVIVSNPPYHIAIPLLLSWLRQILCYRSVTVMLQKEIAEKLVARTSTRQYGRLSVMTQWLCHTHLHFRLPARAFIPPPKVDSAVITLTPRDPIPGLPWEIMEKVTRLAFQQRRKMLRSNFSFLDDPEDFLQQVNIAPTSRAQDIDIPRFVALAQAYQKRISLSR